MEPPPACVMLKHSVSPLPFPPSKYFFFGAKIYGSGDGNESPVVPAKSPPSELRNALLPISAELIAGGRGEGKTVNGQTVPSFPERRYIRPSAKQEEEEEECHLLLVLLP